MVGYPFHRMFDVFTCPAASYHSRDCFRISTRKQACDNAVCEHSSPVLGEFVRVGHWPDRGAGHHRTAAHQPGVSWCQGWSHLTRIAPTCQVLAPGRCPIIRQPHRIIGSGSSTTSTLSVNSVLSGYTPSRACEAVGESFKPAVIATSYCKPHHQTSRRYHERGRTWKLA